MYSLECRFVCTQSELYVVEVLFSLSRFRAVPTGACNWILSIVTLSLSGDGQSPPRDTQNKILYNSPKIRVISYHTVIQLCKINLCYHRHKLTLSFSFIIFKQSLNSGLRSNINVIFVIYTGHTSIVALLCIRTTLHLCFSDALFSGGAFIRKLGVCDTKGLKLNQLPNIPCRRPLQVEGRWGRGLPPPIVSTFTNCEYGQPHKWNIHEATTHCQLFQPKTRFNVSRTTFSYSGVHVLVN